MGTQLGAQHIFIASLEFAYKGSELRGEMAAAELPRLQDMLAAPEGKISYVVRGLQGWDGAPMLEIKLDGQCQLRCQRCLQGFDYPVQLLTSLMLVPDSQLDQPAVEGDEIDSIPADAHLNVLALLEDELLLSLPFAPKHPVGTCQPVVAGYMNEEMERVENPPFAALAKLKKFVKE
ncbi:MAG: YceD family protein [Gallionellaceae bacterium]|nr:YceD family protein [Gallionellaceae bacterium]